MRIQISVYEVFQNACLAVVAAIILVEEYSDGDPWWIPAVLLVGMALLYQRWPRQRVHLYLAAEFALVIALAYFSGYALILGFTFCAHAALLLPNWRAALWIAAMILLNVGAFGYHEGWLTGLVFGLELGIGYASFGYIFYVQKRSEIEHRKTQALLEELQGTHRQLQAYAGQVETLAVAEERNRLAREMHDTLGHRLTVAAVQLEGAQRLIPSDPQRAARLVGNVREQVSEALTELRRSVATLRAPLEADLSLPSALARLAKGFEEATGLPIHLELPDESLTLPETHRLALYRAAQEGLTNVQRHAQAKQAWVQLACAGEQITLTISDDGVGPPATENPSAGFGLHGLRERAARLGGELRLEAHPGGGARLSFLMPLPEQLHEQNYPCPAGR